MTSVEMTLKLQHLDWNQDNDDKTMSIIEGCEHL